MGCETPAPKSPREQYKQEDGSFKVAGEMIISDVIQTFPKAVPIMMGYGLHCVGCAANSFDTIEGGAKLHGMPDAEIQKMISEINEGINHIVETLEFTPNAIKKIKEFRGEEKDKEGWPLRISVKSGGCAGFSYEMDFDEKKPEDETFRFDDLEIVVDKESYKMLKGSSIDFVDGLMGSGFKIDNPNATKSCRCGDSFG